MGCLNFTKLSRWAIVGYGRLLTVLCVFFVGFCNVSVG